MLGEAISYAARAHAGQLRKDKMTPYIAHPVRVMTIICRTFGVDDEAVLAAAVMHDVIEDTTRDYDSVSRLFGNEVADLVAAMSKDPRMPEKPREEAYHDQIANAHWKARLIKLADCYDNILDALDENMCSRACEKARWALSLVKDGDPEPVQAAARMLNEVIEQRHPSPV